MFERVLSRRCGLPETAGKDRQEGGATVIGRPWRRLAKHARAAADFHDWLQRERALAGRMSYRFTLLRLQIRGEARPEATVDRLAAAFRRRLRELDAIGYLAPDTLGVILTGNDEEQARHVACVVCRATRGRGWRNCRFAQYPDAEGTTAAESGGTTSERESTPLPAVNLVDELLSGRIPGWKRGLDVLLSAAALLALAPLLLAVAGLIKLAAPGPALYRQERVGHLGRTFVCLKFRTMRLGSQTLSHQRHLEELIRRGDVPMLKLDTRHDPRLIPLGRLLRAAGIDELPQLINVLRGDMSLVGPRPCIPYEFQWFQPWQRRRCETPPGLTGLWQTSGKNHTSFSQMIRYDLRYAQRRSFRGDLRALLRTPAVVAGQLLESVDRRRAGRHAPAASAEPNV